MNISKNKKFKPKTADGVVVKSGDIVYCLQEYPVVDVKKIKIVYWTDGKTILGNCYLNDIDEIKKARYNPIYIKTLEGKIFGFVTENGYLLQIYSKYCYSDPEKLIDSLVRKKKQEIKILNNQISKFEKMREGLKENLDSLI